MKLAGRRRVTDAVYAKGGRIFLPTNPPSEASKPTRACESRGDSPHDRQLTLGDPDD